jgi:hypothetical protein
MKFNKHHLGVLIAGLVAFLVLSPFTGQTLVDVMLLVDVLGRLFENRTVS